MERVIIGGMMISVVIDIIICLLVITIALTSKMTKLKPQLVKSRRRVYIKALLISTVISILAIYFDIKPFLFDAGEEYFYYLLKYTPIFVIFTQLVVLAVKGTIIAIHMKTISNFRKNERKPEDYWDSNNIFDNK